MIPRALRGSLLAGFIFLLIQLGALALVDPFQAAGYRAVENPTDPTNSLVYVVAILVMTGLMLAAFRFDLDIVVRAAVVGAGGLLAWHVFSVLVPPVVVAGVDVLAVGLAGAVVIALLVYPEWYVVDAAGVVMGIGAAALFGISFGLLPAVLLLAVLAVYDAISVYGTRHMLDLAEGVMDLRVPVVLVIPVTLSYSLLAEDFGDFAADEEGEGRHDGRDGEAEAPRADGEGETPEESKAEDGGDPFQERGALFIGLGDAVMPTVMVASAAAFSPAPTLGVAALPVLNLPALAAMVGTLAGLAVLLWMVAKGRAHAGLPLLNGGAIGGYLLGSVLTGVPLVQAVGLAPYL